LRLRPAVLFSSCAGAAEIKVLSTQATEQSYRELVAAIRAFDRT